MMHNQKLGSGLMKSKRCLARLEGGAYTVGGPI